MRIIYDDQKAPELIKAVSSFLLRKLNLNSVVKFDNGMDRVQQSIIKAKLNEFLKSECSMFIGEKVTHAYGIGNNCAYPVYSQASESELEQVATININHGMFSEVYVNIENYNGKTISHYYEITQHGVKVKYNF